MFAGRFVHAGAMRAETKLVALNELQSVLNLGSAGLTQTRVIQSEHAAQASRTAAKMLMDKLRICAQPVTKAELLLFVLAVFGNRRR